MRRPALALWWLPSLMLGAVWAGQLTSEPAPVEAPGLPPPAASTMAEPPPPPSSAATSEIVNRPLFFPSRAPLPADAVATGPVPPLQPPELTLMGTVVSTQGKVAILRHARQGKPLQLTLGQGVEGWTVAEIGDDRVVMQAGPARHLVQFPQIGVRKVSAMPPAPAARTTPPPVVATVPARGRKW